MVDVLNLPPQKFKGVQLLMSKCFTTHFHVYFMVIFDSYVQFINIISCIMYHEVTINNTEQFIYVDFYIYKRFFV